MRSAMPECEGILILLCCHHQVFPFRPRELGKQRSSEARAVCRAQRTKFPLSRVNTDHEQKRTQQKTYTFVHAPPRLDTFGRPVWLHRGKGQSSEISR